MSGVEDLARWLGEQLDEDERIARAASPGPWKEAGIGDFGWTISGVWVETPDNDQGRADADFIAAHDPTRVLREIDAKRQLIATFQSRYAAAKNGIGLEGAAWAVLADVLRALALPYADRPGYEEAVASLLK